mgnify:CR=1 FL=1
MIKNLCVAKYFFFLLFVFHLAYAEEGEMDKISDKSVEWEYFSDQVMGGVSTGDLSVIGAPNRQFYRLTGNVSTKNNGGFIQFRANISGLDDTVRGVSLKVRGNGEDYYIFIRTTGTFLPWHYYKVAFPTTSNWKSLKIDLKDFKRSSNFLRKSVLAESIRSIGIVAFGKNHKASIDVAMVDFY